MKRFASFAWVVLAGICLANAGMRVSEAQEAGGTVVVTGANRGLGLEFARQFSGMDYQVIGTARNPEEAEELRALGVQVLPLDVADAASVKAFAASLEGRPVDILINNAGIMGHNAGSLAELDIEQLQHSFDVNSLGALRVSQALLPNLRAGQQKKVINISTIMASISANNGGAYAYRSSKAALNMLGKSMAGELGREGFIVVLMHPGWVRTDMGGGSAPLSPEESVSGMIRLINGFQDSDNGRFMDYQGETIAW